MATTNVGRVGQVWQGAYNAGTAYVLDDVVEYNTSPYICIQAGTGQTPSSATAYWTNMATASGLTSIASLAAGDMVYYNGSAWARIPKGTASQSFKVNAGANGYDYGTGGGVVKKVHWYADRTRRNHGQSNQVNQWSGVNFINKVSATSTILIEAEISGIRNNGNDCSLHRIEVTDSASNVWAFTGSYKGNGGHVNGMNPAPIVFQIGPSTNSQHRITGSATHAAAGQMTWSCWCWSANASSSSSYLTTNPDTNDDNRLWAHSDTRSTCTKAIVFEVEV